jgi:ABC-type phosphate/phosphonate transport system substrate-binding protein
MFSPNSEVQLLVQEDAKTHRELAGKAPLAIDFARTPEERAVLEIFYSQAIFTRPFIFPPDVPKERVAAMRKAFMETMNSLELQTDARKQQTEAEASPGEDVAALIDKIYASSPNVVEQLKKASGK